MITDMTPESKPKVIESFIDWLFSSVMAPHRELFLKIETNQFYAFYSELGQDAMCFRYKGVTYNTRKLRRPPPSLIDSCHEDMDSWLANEELYNPEKEKVRIFLSACLAECTSIYQLPDLLPEQCITWFKALIPDERPEYATYLKPECVAAFHLKHKTNMDVLLARITKNLLGIK